MKYGKILEKLIIGPCPDDDKILELKKMGMTAILSILNNDDPIKPETVERMAKSNGLIWANVAIRDAFYKGIPTAEKIKEAVDKIEEWLSNNHKIYLHCLVGQGRSPLIATAYLCMKKNERFFSAIAKVKNSWPIADPNIKQIRVLLELLDDANL